MNKPTLPQIAILAFLVLMPFILPAPKRIHRPSDTTVRRIAKEYRDNKVYQADLTYRAIVAWGVTQNPKVLTAINWRGVTYLWK